MQIRKVGSDYNFLSFRSSQLNIVSTGDNHGDVLGVPTVIKTIQKNKRDLFEKSDDNGTFNFLTIVGDFFMNPAKKGLLTHPHLSSGDIQYNFLNETIKWTNRVSGRKNNFDALYVLGNHCLDGGDEWILNKLSKAPMTTLLTNVDLKKSPLASKLVDNNPRMVQTKEYAIPDNKNPEKLNHVLFLGVTIPSMNYYNPGLLTQTQFYDNSNKNDALLKEEDLQKTFKVADYYVRKFKKDNPKGAVILLAHTGNRISEMIVDNVPGINLILNGHDHKQFETMYKNTMILSHGQNNDFIRGVQVKFDDKGNLSSIRSRKFDTAPYEQRARQDEKMQEFVNKNLRTDLVPLVKFQEGCGEAEEMVLDDSVRYSNSVLANYITSAIKTAVHEQYPEIDAVGLPATIFRSGLKTNLKRSTMNNIDLMRMFDGVSENLSKVRVGKITGEELSELVVENVLNNLESKTRNALIQWSDVQIDKLKIREIKSGKLNGQYKDAIKFRNNKTGKFEPIDQKKEYCILLSDKYLLKDTENIKYPQKIRNKFEKTDETYESLFRKYLKMVDYNVKITDQNRELRIIDKGE